MWRPNARYPLFPQTSNSNTLKDLLKQRKKEKIAQANTAFSEEELANLDSLQKYDGDGEDPFYPKKSSSLKSKTVKKKKLTVQVSAPLLEGGLEDTLLPSDSSSLRSSVYGTVEEEESNSPAPYSSDTMMIHRRTPTPEQSEEETEEAHDDDNDDDGDGDDDSDLTGTVRPVKRELKGSVAQDVDEEETYSATIKPFAQRDSAVSVPLDTEEREAHSEFHELINGNRDSVHTEDGEDGSGTDSPGLGRRTGDHLVSTLEKTGGHKPLQRISAYLSDGEQVTVTPDSPGEGETEKSAGSQRPPTLKLLQREDTLVGFPSPVVEVPQSPRLFRPLQAEDTMVGIPSPVTELPKSPRQFRPLQAEDTVVGLPRDDAPGLFVHQSVGCGVY